jgi:hypothetical protein
MIVVECVRCDIRFVTEKDRIKRDVRPAGVMGSKTFGWCEKCTNEFYRLKMENMSLKG